MFVRRFRDISVQEVTYTLFISTIFYPQIYSARYPIKCTSVNELSHRIAKDFVNKTTSNWQGKVHFHYFCGINIPLQVDLKILPLRSDSHKRPPSHCILDGHLREVRLYFLFYKENAIKSTKIAILRLPIIHF